MGRSTVGIVAALSKPPTLILCCALALGLGAGCQRQDSQAPPKEPIDFNQHVAPILFAHCSPCHRPGQSAPFPLLSYADARKHARQIAQLTASRTMPPWLPDGPVGEFTGDRRLSAAQIGVLGRWVEDGLREGSAQDARPAPTFPSDWPLGEPDLVARLPEGYSLAADGPNVYRNFVLPLNLRESRWVRAVDFRPHSASVHHALIAFDRTGAARQWDAKDAEPGFTSFKLPSGMETPNEFLGWHPGKQPSQSLPGLAWTLSAGSDLVLQLHLRPTGKPERIAPEVGFYFTNIKPTNEPTKISISPLAFSIPPGASNQAVRGTFALPGDADLLALEPHAHFLGRSVTGSARLPDGTRRTLLHVPEWDFNWQDYYRFARPVFLPAGTVLEMEWQFDNTTNNARNPNVPLKTVGYGLESADEMAVMNFQILPRNEAAAQRIYESLLVDADRHNVEYNTHLLRKDPNNGRAHAGLARALMHFGQYEPAAQHAAIARRLDPRDDDAALLVGMVAYFRKQPLEARSAFEDCVRLNPNHPRAHGCLANLAVEQGWMDVAEFHLRETLRIDPKDDTAKAMLKQIGR